MTHVRARSVRTTLVGTVLAVVCLISAGKIWFSAEQSRPEQATATVEQVVFVERGEWAAVPEVTATFDLAGGQVEAVFTDVDGRLEAGDQFTIRYDWGQPSAGIPSWQAEQDRESGRLVAGCLLIAALIAVALVRTERETTHGEPTHRPADPPGLATVTQ